MKNLSVLLVLRVVSVLALASCDQSSSMADKPRRVGSTTTADSSAPSPQGSNEEQIGTRDSADSLPEEMTTPPPAAPAPFAITSTAFQDKGKIPLLHVAAGAGGMNQSPPLAWSGAPAGAGSFAIHMVDLANARVHWVITDIPATSKSLPGNIAAGGPLTAPPEAAGAVQPVQGRNVYGGPNPPNLHNYEFTIFAIKPGAAMTLTTDAAANRTALEANSLGKAVIVGTFDPANP